MNGQDQVGIRPAIAAARRLRASEIGTDYGVIGFGTRKQLLLETFPFPDREQRNSHRSVVPG